MDKEHPGRKHIKAAMDKATKDNLLMKIAFTTENTWYKARAHATLAARPWHLRNTEHE